MRVQARGALGLLSLVLTAPAWVNAAPVDGVQPTPIAGGYQPTPMVNGYQPMPVANSYPQAPMASQPAPISNSYQPAWMPNQPAPRANAAEAPAPHQHHGLFGWRHCVECQRAHVKQRYGVDIPPPPSLATGTAMQGQVIMSPGTRCATCEGGVVSGPVMAADPHAPGYAVVGGSMMMAGGGPGYSAVGGNVAAAGAPGYAVAGGAAGIGPEPSPIGVARSTTQPQWGTPAMAAYGPRAGAGAYDPAVMPSSIPPAQNALAPPDHPRPHVIRHLLGIPNFGDHRREREARAREKHAAIAYDQPNAPVTEIPASMVFGNGNKGR